VSSSEQTQDLRSAKVKNRTATASCVGEIRAMKASQAIDKRSRHKHRWNGQLCACGARQCAASELRRVNESGQCRCSAQPDSRYCKRHAYIDRVRFRSSTAASPALPGLEAA